MGMTSYSKFDVFKNTIYALPCPFHDEAITAETFLLEESDTKNLAIYYSPVEFINEDAVILIVGITPGFRQMKRAYLSVLENGRLDSDEQILQKAKVASSYEGSMRKNLIQMLDQLELPEHLQISSSADLFGSMNQLVHTTGLMPYPVFHKGKNFTGSNPDIWKTPTLKKYVLDCFVTDVARLNNPLIIPLGVNVTKVLKQLSDSQLLANAHILTGFPHPSGANGHRHKQFAANKEQMQQKIADYFHYL